MTPQEEAAAALAAGLSCIVVPMPNGDLAILDRAGNFMFTANPDPLIHGGIGMGGLLNAFEIAFNRSRSRSASGNALSGDAPYYRLKVRSARPAGEYYRTHPRPQTAAPLPPGTKVWRESDIKREYTGSAAAPAQTVLSAASLGISKKPR